MCITSVLLFCSLLSVTLVRALDFGVAPFFFLCSYGHGSEHCQSQAGANEGYGVLCYWMVGMWLTSALNGAEIEVATK